jgi:glycerol-3-phosphate dehydrogenase
MSKSRAHVVVVGGGGTGAATAHDFALRGLEVTLFERGELTSGTTGRHHGQLHSGARYAVRDPAIGRECIQEVEVLRRIAPASIEMNYGLFLALSDEDAEYGREFEESCRTAGITFRRISTEQALRYEPAANPQAKFAEVVPDGTLDAYRLPLQFLATAKHNGAVIRPFTEVEGIDVENGTVTGVVVRDHRSGREERVAADAVVSTTGPWAGIVAGRAGVSLDITPAPGTMVAVSRRICNMVISHLHPPGDGDIVVPQRRLSIIGSTQWETESPDDVETPESDIPLLLDRARDLLPSFADHDVHASWTAVRPLAGVSRRGGRLLSRDFAVLSHAADGARGFYSAIGGKATVLRAMAERLVDVVCADLGIEVSCETAHTPLLTHRAFFRGTE